jgi:hypothetical protein
MTFERWGMLLPVYRFSLVYLSIIEKFSWNQMSLTPWCTPGPGQLTNHFGHTDRESLHASWVDNLDYLCILPITFIFVMDPYNLESLLQHVTDSDHSSIARWAEFIPKKLDRLITIVPSGDPFWCIFFSQNASCPSAMKSNSSFISSPTPLFLMACQYKGSSCKWEIGKSFSEASFNPVEAHATLLPRRCLQWTFPMRFPHCSLSLLKIDIVILAWRDLLLLMQVPN